jgi:glycerol-3-phosphate dehydrogenase
LDDLLLRRVRLGLLAPNGGLDQIERIRGLVQFELGWDDARWQAEVDSYAQLWRTSYRFR